MKPSQSAFSRSLFSRLFWLAMILVGVTALAACQPIQAPEMDHSPEVQEAGAMLPEGNAEAGKLVLAAAVGCGCHFNGDLGTLAGGNTFEGDFGSVTSANLTPDEATGIGNITDEQLADAIRIGRSPVANGENLFIMPRYAGMADQDVADLIAYLRSLDPIQNEIPVRELAFEVPAFEVTEAPPAVAPSDPVARGRYIATLARCSRCHTPTDEDGSPNMEMLLAGAPFRSTVAPNLTPDDATGLGMWSDEELANFLATGLYSDGSEAAGAMKSVVDQGIGLLTDEDRMSLVAFLRSLPAVQNLPATQE